MKNIVMIVGTLLGFAIFGCGVKGDPKPPLTPASLGHGQPSFKRATKALGPSPNPEANQPNVNPVNANDSSEQE